MIEPGENLVMVVGLPCTGKSSLVAQLAAEFPEYKVLYTHDYDFDKMRDLAAEIRKHEKVIVDGSVGVVLLSHGIKADLVIKCDADPETRRQRYAERGKEFEALTGFDKMLENKWDKFINHVDKLPRIRMHRT